MEIVFDRKVILLKVLVHAIFGPENPRGVGRYVDELISHAIRQDSITEFILIVGDWMKAYTVYNIQASNVTVLKLQIPRNKWMRNAWNLTVFPRLVRKLNPDVVHITDTSPIMRMKQQTLSTIHDLAEFRVTGKYSRIQTVLRRWIVRVQCKFSDHIIAVSRSTANDLKEFLAVPESKISVIYNGAFISNPEDSELGEDRDEEYLLYVGQIEETKNVDALVRAFIDLKKSTDSPQLKLYLAGGIGNGRKKLEFALQEAGVFRNSIRVLGFVSDKDLLRLYRGARAFAYLSSFEGFGLPVLEAMVFGLPVLCNDIPVFREIADDAAEFCSLNRNDISAGLARILFDQQLRSTLSDRSFQIAQRYRWNYTANATLQEYYRYQTYETGQSYESIN